MQARPEERLGGRGGVILGRCLLVACVFVFASKNAEALDGNGGVGVGAALAGARPHVAVSPHGAIGWTAGNGFLLALDGTISILLATNRDGVGVHGRLSLEPGYTTESFSFSAGPSFSLYSMAVCNTASWCGRVSGASLGVNAQASFYFWGPLGLSVSASVDWAGGDRNLLLPRGVTAMVAAGPVFRWVGR